MSSVPPASPLSALSSASAIPLDAWAIPAAVFDGQGRLLACNAPFETLSGYAALEGFRPALFSVRYGDDTLLDLFDAAQTMDLPTSGVAALTRADTVVLDVSWSLGLWPQASGESPLYLLTATDITDEKCLACKIKHSRDKYREAFDEQTEMVCRFDPDSTIRFVNDAYAQALALSPRDLIGRKLTEFLTPQDGEIFLQYLQSFTVDHSVRDGEESYEVAAGIRRHYWWRRRALFDHTGKLCAFQSVGRDITLRKQKEAESARLARLVEASPVIGLRLRYAPGWPVEYVTDNIERLLGWRPDDLVSGFLSPLSLLHSADRDAVLSDYRAHAREGRSFRHVLRLLTRDGAVRWFEASVLFEKDFSGKVTHLEAMLHDVTDFVAAQEQIIASEHRLLDFASAANDWFWEMGPDFVFSWISSHDASVPQTIDLLPLVGRSCRDLFDHDGAPQVWENHYEDLKHRRPFRDFRFMAQLPNGQSALLSVSGRPVFDGDGTFLGYRGSSTDVTAEERTAQALLESHRRYRTIFDSADVGLWDLNLTHLLDRFAILRGSGVRDLSAVQASLFEAVQVNAVNAAARMMLALPKTGGWNWTSPAFEHLRRLLWPVIEALWDGVENVRVDTVWWQHGSQRNLLVSLRAPLTPEDAEQCIVSILDITARVQTEQDLRDSERRFRNIFDYAVSGMALISLEGGWLRVNPSLCRLVGKTQDEVFASQALDCLHPDSAAGVRAWMMAAHDRQHGHYSEECRLYHVSGREVWIHLSLVLLCEQDGRPLYFMGQAVDISTRKEAERRATQAEAQLREAITAMDDGFVLYDANDRLVAWNHRFAEIYSTISDLLQPGVEFETLLQSSVRNGQYATLPEHYEEWLEERRKIHVEGSGVGREEMLYDGRWVQIKERRTRDGGTVGVRADITRQKAREAVLRQAMEEARLADRAKSEFLANMSHELRTPLNAIIGFSEILSNEMFGALGSPLYREYAEGIHDSGRHLLQIISDILDLSKIEAGELTLEREEIDVCRVAEAALRMVRPRADARRIALELDLAPEIPRLWVDELRFKQILINLLSNAVKFTEPQKAVRIWWQDRGEDGVAIVVEDQGIGMSPQEISIARSLFGQVQSAFSRQIQGTGLGLPICIKLMESHGGRLSIDSIKGEGTRVFLEFPASAVRSA